MTALVQFSQVEKKNKIQLLLHSTQSHTTVHYKLWLQNFDCCDLFCMRILVQKNKNKSFSSHKKGAFLQHQTNLMFAKIKIDIIIFYLQATQCLPSEPVASFWCCLILECYSTKQDSFAYLWGIICFLALFGCISSPKKSISTINHYAWVHYLRMKHTALTKGFEKEALSCHIYTVLWFMKALFHRGCCQNKM